MQLAVELQSPGKGRSWYGRRVEQGVCAAIIVLAPVVAVWLGGLPNESSGQSLTAGAPQPTTVMPDGPSPNAASAFLDQYRASATTPSAADPVQSCESYAAAGGASVSVLDHGTGQTYNVDAYDACVKATQAFESTNAVSAVYSFKNGQLVAEYHKEVVTRTATALNGFVDTNSPVLWTQTFDVKRTGP